jgi:hypothetical protein
LTSTIGDPRRSDDDNKRLTFSESGRTSNTRVWVDGTETIYGYGGTVVTPMRDDGGVKTMVWDYRRVRVTQRLSIVLSAKNNLYDTLRIEYVLENLDTVAHGVGLRVMIDTLIGSNDGVPFSIPGRAGITDRAVDLRGKDVPDFIQALENADLTKPGVIVNITVRGGDATPPERVLITGWYDSAMPWDFLQGAGGVGAPLRRGGLANGIPDSAIGLYYPVQELPPGERRQIVAFYGLGDISSVRTGNPNLGLSVSSNRVEEGALFSILAIISNPQSGQRVQLQLPPELELVQGDVAQAVVPQAGANFTTASWQVRASAPSAGAEIVVTLDPPTIRERQTIVITRRPPTLTPTPTVPRATPSPTRGGITR